MEQYLIKDYGVVYVEYEETLTEETCVTAYFVEEWADYFHFDTQGEFWETFEATCECNGKFFNVFMKVDYWGSKQDRGDKMYYADSLTELKVTEIEKPQPKERKSLTFTASLSKDEARRVRELFGSFGVTYTEAVH